PEDRADQDAAFATMHEALVSTCRMLAPILPFVTDTMYGNLVSTVEVAGPDSVHLTPWPTADLADRRDEALEGSMAVARRTVDLARPLRSANRLKTRQPLAQAWLAAPDRGAALDEALLALIAEEINVK